MDKYTVDLDKVLNDFEYSELTEQSSGFNSNSVSSAANLQQSFSYSGANSASNHYATKPTYSYDSTLPYEPATTYPKVSNSSAKHTINNVFHSLNEYLNSDIRTDLDQPGSSLADIKEIEADIPTLVRKSSAEKFEMSKIQDIFKTITKDENSSLVDNLCAPPAEHVIDTTITSELNSCPNSSQSQNLGNIKTINNNINSELNLNRIKDTNIQTSDEHVKLKVEKVKNTDENVNLKADKVKNINENTSVNGENVKSNDDRYVKMEKVNNSDVNMCAKVEKVNNIENTNVKIQKVNNDIDNIYVETKKVNNINEDTSIQTEIVDPSNDTSQNEDKLQHTSEDTVIRAEEQELINVDVTIEAQHAEENIETVTDKELDNSAEVQAVGFEDLDISDTDMENELAELEQEYNGKTDDNNTGDKYLDTLKLSDNDDNELSTEKNLKSELEEVIGTVRNDFDERTVIFATNETDLSVIEISESLESDNLNSNMPDAKEQDDELQITEDVDKENTYLSDNVQATTEINDNTDVPTGTFDVQVIVEAPELCITTQHESNEIMAQPEITIQQNCEVTNEIWVDRVDEIHDVPAINIQTEHADSETVSERRNSTLLRPNSLDLNSEPPSETLTINLIGEPGSTPYNNVYVENSLNPTKDTQTCSLTEPEIEASTSLSPTLSDASTYENTDSPNTSDSCNDTSFEEQPHDSDTVNTKTSTDPAKGTHLNNQSSTATSSVINSEVQSTSAQASDGNTETSTQGSLLGKTAPFWTPDADALCCLHCNQKFTVIRRRHHCRACGLVLCSKCCNMKYKLEYMDHVDSRVCLKCYDILNKETTVTPPSSGSDNSPESPVAGATSRGLNPNNPMDYCSTVPPLEQVGTVPSHPPTVMVPVGVLKRKGSGKSRSAKSVMFCDGIRPGCDLTELDRDFNYKEQRSGGSSGETGTSKKQTTNNVNMSRANRNLPKIDTKTSSYIPSEENSLPPIVNVLKSDIFYADCSNNNSVVEMLKQETITFALQRNLHVQVRIINMDCCINKHAWCFTTDGMIAVGQDEIVILLESIDNEKTVPKDVFLHLSNIYNDAVKGTSITELGLSIHPSSNFLESKNHVGFLFVKPTFQCIQNVILPTEPYLVGILIHRWETPWAKIFPLRLLLRLGAEYRYYPSPIISTRHRESVYVEIGHTIINLLADFRNFSYTIPSVRGLTIHMEEKNTTVSIPINRYDQVIKALNNSSDHILAFAANFSPNADSHLVCIQDTHGNNENAYTTHAINIHNKPRKGCGNIHVSVTGASFIVLNGALKSSSGLTAKSSIIEDGLMIQILPDQMVKLRTSLRNMKDFKINCGCVNAQSDESVSILWTENDTNFNVGIISPIDKMPMNGIPSIRVHNGKDYVCNSGNKMIRWTEVFIIQSGEENARTQDPVDISKVSENISKATCQALVKYLDLLATNSFTKIGIRTTLHVENVSYLAGSNNTKLPPIYMKSLDNELVPVLHKITTNNFGEQAVVLELVFHILNM